MMYKLLIIVLIVFAFYPLHSAFAASSTQSASTAVNAADATNCSSASQLSWNSASNSTAQDDTNASVTHAQFDLDAITNRLDDTNFGFALTSGSMIDGIVVEIDKHASVGGAVDHRVQLFKAGSLVGSNKADTSTAWAASDSDAYTSYGGSSDLWGTTWSESDIENTGFGVTVCAKATADNTDVHVDHIRVTVYYTEPDTTAPAAVTDLALSNPSNSAMTVSWTAPGDDGSTGTASTYDLRYSTANITDANWSSATEVTGEPTPAVAGSSESMNVTGLSPETTYYFALKTSDEVPNESGLSNVPSLATTATPDTTAPAAVTDLAASNATETAIDLAWTAPGDDGSIGTANSYDVRYSTAAITDGNWSSATQVTGEPTPSVAGTSESMNVSGLSANTTYYFALKTSDEAPNESGISNVPSLSTLAASTPTGGVGAPDYATAIFSGVAYPGGTIEFFRRNRLAVASEIVGVATSTVGDDGTFSITLEKLIKGDYLFSLQAIDKDGRKSGIVGFNVDFIFDTSSFKADDIFVPPTAGFDTAVVTRGNNLVISGYAAPNTTVEVEIDGILNIEITSDSTGSYTFSTSTRLWELGEYFVKVRQIDDGGRASNYSLSKTFKISLLRYPKADFNNDNTVNITDWSIFLFRWGSDDEALRLKVDMDSNDIIDISDFSIFLKAMKI